MAYIKPQSPLKLGEDHIYPLTTYDQILMPDGSRWEGLLDTGNKLFINRFTMTLPADSWVLENEEGPYTQQISLSGILSKDVPIIDINMAGINTKDAVAELKNNWALVDNYEIISNDTIKFSCWEEPPAIDLPLKLIAFSASSVAEIEYPLAEEAIF